MTTNEHLLKLLKSENPAQELQDQRASGLLKSYLPEVDALYGVPQRPEHHPEIDVGIHMELCMEQSRRLKLTASERFAVLVHDLGKGITPAEILPRHHDHERTGIPLVKAVCDRLGIEGMDRELALLMCEQHIRLHSIFSMRSSRILSFIRDARLLDDAGLAMSFINACLCDIRGRAGNEFKNYSQGQFMLATLGMFERTEFPSNIAENHKAKLDIVRLMRKVHDINYTKQIKG